MKIARYLARWRDAIILFVSVPVGLIVVPLTVTKAIAPGIGCVTGLALVVCFMGLELASWLTRR